MEASFFGLTPWVIAQRVTLPLAAFFRFHSAVVAVDLWKGVYRKRGHGSGPEQQRRETA